jgi:glucan-binding YG repeat protein
VAHSSLLDFNSQITTTTTKSVKHFKTLNGGVSAAAVAPPSSSGIDAFDAVKDAERKAKNAASAKKSRQIKQQAKATRDKQVEEMEWRNQKLDKKINKTKQLINAMSSLVLDVKLQNLFGDSTTPTHGTTITTFSPGSFYQQMEQETNTTCGMLHHHDVVDEVARVPVFNLPLFDLLLNVTSTATRPKEEESNAVIKATDETQYSEEEAPLEMQQNDLSSKFFFIDSGIE